MKQIVIIYHKNCIDGFAGAWAAWGKFGKKAEYIAVDPSVLPEKPLRGKEVYIIDNGYPAPILKKLIKENRKVIVLDHHESREKDIKHFPQNVYDVNHSGAVIAWKYFFPKKKTPRLLMYVEDEDLWRFRLPYSEEISSVLGLFDFDFKAWGLYVKRLENKAKFKKLIEQGRTILEYERKTIAFIIRRTAVRVQLGKYKVLAVASPILESDLGHELAKQGPFGIVWRTRPDGGIGVSLRSNGKVDVAKIAARYGGGGHVRSAGFTVERGKKVPWKVIE